MTPTRFTASRRRLLLWTLAPWLGIFLLAHLILIGCRLPTMEGLFTHALGTALGAGFLTSLLGAKSAPALLVTLLVSWTALVASEVCFIRARKLIYLVAFEILASLFFLGGILVMLVLQSV